MARTGRVNHTHKYFRHDNGLWHCAGIDGCSHYVPKNMPEPYGRLSICWGCEKPFMLTPMSMRQDKPRCDACSENMDIIEQLLKNHGLDDDEDRVTRGIKVASEKARQSIKPIIKRDEVDDISDEIEVIEPDE